MRKVKNMKRKNTKRETIVTRITRGICTLAGALAFMVGIVICACEQPTMAEQLRTWGIGVPVILGGAVAMWIGEKVSECNG